MQETEQPVVTAVTTVTEAESPKQHGPRPERKPKHFQRRKPNHQSHASAGNMQDIDEMSEPVEVEPVNVVPLDPSQPAPSRHGQPWTSVERVQVSNAFREGMPVEQISLACGRSNFAVACHLEYAGLLPRVEAFKYAKSNV